MKKKIGTGIIFIIVFEYHISELSKLSVLELFPPRPRKVNTDGSSLEIFATRAILRQKRWLTALNLAGFRSKPRLIVTRCN